MLGYSRANTNTNTKKKILGWLLVKFCNFAVPDTVDIRALNRGDNLGPKPMRENMILAIEACRAIGAPLGKLNARDVIDVHKGAHKAINLIWSAIREQLLLNVNLRRHPELMRAMSDDGSGGLKTQSMAELSPRSLLIMWMNYHLSNAVKSNDDVRATVELIDPSTKQFSPLVKTFTDDSLNKIITYAVLLTSLCPEVCNPDWLWAITKETDIRTRIRLVRQTLVELGFDNAIIFFFPQRNSTKISSRLHLAFVACLFSHRTGLTGLSNDEMKQAELMDDEEGDREERSFRLWINSMGIEMEDKDDTLQISNLFSQSRDGVLLLKLLETIRPGCVDWKKVYLNPTIRFHQVANCNEVVRLGRELGFSLVGIGGADIVDGNHKLVGLGSVRQGVVCIDWWVGRLFC